MGQWNGNTYVGDSSDELAVGTAADEVLIGPGDCGAGP